MASAASANELTTHSRPGPLYGRRGFQAATGGGKWGPQDVPEELPGRLGVRLQQAVPQEDIACTPIFTCLVSGNIHTRYHGLTCSVWEAKNC